MAHSFPAGRPRAVLFDLDGTLVDSYPAIQASVNHIRSRHGLSPLSLDDVRRAVGHGVHRLMAATAPGGDVEDDVQEFLRHHPSVVGPGTRPLPEVSEVLAKLHAAGMRLAVCSNKPLPLTQLIVQAQGWEKLFDAVLGPESAGRPKPAPDMLQAGMKQMGVAPEQSLYVGDMAIDVETARNAGTAVWVLPTGSHSREQLLESHPDRLLERFSQLLELI